jgi:hypothetical protein
LLFEFAGTGTTLFTISRLQTPKGVTFDDMLVCLSFSGLVELLNFEKGLTDGFALQVMQEILTRRLIHIPNRKRIKSYELNE